MSFVSICAGTVIGTVTGHGMLTTRMHEEEIARETEALGTAREEPVVEIEEGIVNGVAAGLIAMQRGAGG